MGHFYPTKSFKGHFPYAQTPDFYRAPGGIAGAMLPSHSTQPSLLFFTKAHTQRPPLCRKFFRGCSPPAPLSRGTIISIQPSTGAAGRSGHSCEAPRLKTRARGRLEVDAIPMRSPQPSGHTSKSTGEGKAEALRWFSCLFLGLYGASL